MDKCTICNKEYSPLCDYKQGRCPHHPPMINVQPKDTSRGHFYVSLIKSGLRIIAGVFLMTGALWMAGMFFIGAELLGILEELV